MKSWGDLVDTGDVGQGNILLMFWLISSLNDNNSHFLDAGQLSLLVGSLLKEVEKI